MKASQIDGRSVLVEGKTYLYFGSTSYLNLPYEKQFQDYITEGMSVYGSGLGSSPTTSPSLSVYSELENRLAYYYGFENALLFSSGRAASQALIKLASQKYRIEYGPFAHEAIRINEVQKGEEIWANDFLDPFNLERTDFLLELPKGPKIIDASHAFSVLDNELASFCKDHGAFACGSLNKGFGIHAGLVLCDNVTKAALQKTLEYQSSSNASPALCYGLLNAFENGLIKTQQEKLQSLLGHIAQSPFFTLKPPFPVAYLNHNTCLYDELRDQGILLWKGGYGDKIEKANRLVITSGHTTDDLNRLLNSLPTN